MRYVMSSQWTEMECSEVTDAGGVRQFEVRRNLGSRITLDGADGQDADIRSHTFTDSREVYVACERAAEVPHHATFGNRFVIESRYGPLVACGDFGRGDYTLSRGGLPVAHLARAFSSADELAIDVADGELPTFLIAILLAIEASQAERGTQQRGSTEFMDGVRR